MLFCFPVNIIEKQPDETVQFITLNKILHMLGTLLETFDRMQVLNSTTYASKVWMFYSIYLGNVKYYIFKKLY